MKRLFTVAIILLGVLFQLSFRKNEVEPAIRSIIMKQANLFSVQVDVLHQAALDFATRKITLATLRQQLQRTRTSYKGIEYIVEYYYPEHVKEHLNGPPLYHADPYPHNTGSYYTMPAEEYVNSAPLDYLERDHYLGSPKVIAPRGLQVLDELIFSEEVAEQKQQVQQLTGELKKKWAIVLQALEKRKYYQPFEIMEASRQELIRVFTLGVTGFDTPGSQNALPEARAALQALQQVLSGVEGQTGSRPLSEVEGETMARVNSLFANAIKSLSQARDFSTFDRLGFLKQAINPLYEGLMQVHQQLALATTQQLTGQPASLNFQSTNLFGADFLNPYYYSLLKEDKDSEALARLGKKLFYDTRISHTGKLSCGSCHKAELAFTDGAIKSFTGEGGHTVQRNAPSLINAVYADRYFYDLRSFDLEDQAGQVIRNHLEFDTDFPELLQRINADTAYTIAFDRIFSNKNKQVSRSQFSTALSSYLISLRSFNSEFDQYVRGERKTISPKVKDGFNLFMGKANCGTCHYAPLFSGLVPSLYHENESEVLGVLENPVQRKVDGDMGRAANKVFHEDLPIYNRAFKTVGVRNVALTAPYFHNGAYTSLEQVIDFYDQGGAAGIGLGNELPNQTLAPDSLHLSKYEKSALIAFLHSLTDSLAIKKFAIH
jgi:cytochrome c peroxidase